MLLSATQLSPPHALTSAVQPKVVGVDYGHSNLHVSAEEISNFTSVVNSNDGRIVYEVGVLNQSFLNSIDVLLISSPTSPYSQIELNLLSSWYLGGGRIWLEASSEDTSAITNINSILRNLTSSLGLEYAYARDPLFNLNSTAIDSDDLIAPIVNHAVETQNLTRDVRIMYGFRPVPILGYIAPSYLQFNSTTQINTILLAETSGTAEARNISSTAPAVFSNGQRAKFPLAVVETKGSSRLALTGCPLTSTWKEHYNYTQNRPHDNRVLARNILKWLASLNIISPLEVLLPQVKAGSQPQVVIDTASLNTHVSDAELKPLRDLLTDMGFSVSTLPAWSHIYFGNASVVIIQSPQRILNGDERTEIVNWLAGGNRTLIMTDNANYSLNDHLNETRALNTLLLDANSNLRFEEAALYDPELNLGGNQFLTLSSAINHDSSSLSNITTNTRSLFLQFATILIGQNSTGPIPLEQNLNQFPEVTWISRTSNSSHILNLNPNFSMLAHKDGDNGSFITAAEEKKGTNRLILFGGPIFSDFSHLLEYPTIYGYPIDNLILIRNIFRSLLTQVQITTEIRAAASPSEIPEGGSTIFSMTYSALQMSVSDLKVERVPIHPANITFSFAGSSVNLTRLSNGTYTTTLTPQSTGTSSWSLTAAARGYQSQSTNGNLQVNPLPTRFTWFVLGIPVVVFITVTIAVVARKTR